MKTPSFYLLGLAALLLGFSACQKEEKTPEPEPLEVQRVNDLPADPTSFDPATGRPTGGTGLFTLYSLRENRIVPNADSATGQWDIGFRGTTIIVNGGAIRSGQGGAYVHTGTFEELNNVPEDAPFRQDNSTSDLAIPSRSGEGWYNYNAQANLITPIPGRVIVLRTANGQFAKIEILSYYQGAPANPTASDASRHYTFRFVYQPEGRRF